MNIEILPATNGDLTDLTTTYHNKLISTPRSIVLDGRASESACVKRQEMRL